MSKVIIIGGGASGLMAAYSALINNNDVILLEKNGECGKKLNICGKGRGNITNSCDIKEFIEAFGKNGKFLYSVFSQFSNKDLINLFESNNLSTIEERGGRIFPKSQIAKDITNFFLNKIKYNVKIKYGTKADKIIIDNNNITGVKIHDGIIKCDKVILATGGMSYPKTGSCGDGYKIASELGHTINKIKPAICPILCNNDYIIDLAGLSLKNIEAKLINKKNNKILKREFGEMIFTHNGVSGPIILTLSKYLADEDNILDYNISLDLKPALNEEFLHNKFTKEFKSNIIIKNYFNTILPKSLAKIFSLLCNINENKKINSITKEERKKIISNLKNFKLEIIGLANIDEAIITKGGIDIKEINPKTLESKIIKGLYFCGEIIDIDAKTGGFNLQAAFSTGFVAGKLQ